MNHSTDVLFEKSVVLLKQLIGTPSFSKEENDTAEILSSFFNNHNIPFSRVGNNIYAKYKFYDPGNNARERELRDHLKRLWKEKYGY